MFYSTKVKEVLKYRELMRLNSLNKQVPKATIQKIVLFCTILYLVSFPFNWWTTQTAPPLMRSGGYILYFCIYALAILFLFLFTVAKGNPLIITERGIAFPPFYAEYWADIEECGWEEYKGILGLPGQSVFSTAEGVCLRIKNKGIIQHALPRGNSLFANALIFFSPEQRSTAESIFKEHGVKKIGQFYSPLTSRPSQNIKYENHVQQQNRGDRE